MNTMYKILTFLLFAVCGSYVKGNVTFYNNSILAFNIVLVRENAVGKWEIIRDVSRLINCEEEQSFSFDALELQDGKQLGIKDSILRLKAVITDALEDGNTYVINDTFVEGVGRGLSFSRKISD